MLGIILQARMGSTRLPGKVIKKIGDKNLLEHIFYRLKFLKHNTKVVLATSDYDNDNIIEELCRKNNIDCFRGDQKNVLERYYFCAKQYGFKHIIRLTGDNPFIDIEELDKLIDFHIETKVDYSSSFNNLPIGVGSEIFTFESLQTSYFNGKDAHHLEHVNEYILENKDKFKTADLKIYGEKNIPSIRLTVDTKEDYQAACFIVKNASSEYITTQEAVRLFMNFKKIYL